MFYIRLINYRYWRMPEYAFGTHSYELDVLARTVPLRRSMMGRGHKGSHCSRDNVFGLVLVSASLHLLFMFCWQRIERHQ